MNDLRNDNSWRQFQSGYIKKKRRQKRFITAIKTAAGLCLCLLMISLIALKVTGREDPILRTIIKPPDQTPDTPEPVKPPLQLSKEQLAPIIDPADLVRSDQNIYFVDTADHSYKVTTTIDIDLQEYLLSVLKRLRKLDRGKPQRIALVVMEADTGKILAMTGFDLADDNTNPCIESDYPAASIFKIVTAAAAVETLGYNPDTQLHFNGNKYTLYKRQLKDVINKYSYKISFARAFAESINPVFGKLGQNKLGKDALEAYAQAFGFNRQIETELPVFSGIFFTRENKYHLAELGSGFNTDTTISPVFGAMMTSAVINSGRVMVPSIIEHVTDADGKLIYQNKKTTYTTAIRPETASTMMTLMQKTVTRGTAKKSFRGASKDKVLSRLLIGGKTGSLYNKEHTVRYDWFTGFGKEKETRKKIAVSVVVGHRKYIGTRASTYAKLILKRYFKP
ncbi:MAG: PbpA, partial [Desulfobacterales bacterium]|nr:PbpA [Desulfobacterales bacterium]